VVPNISKSNPAEAGGMQQGFPGRIIMELLLMSTFPMKVEKDGVDGPAASLRRQLRRRRIGQRVGV
jgi:hypothetical protein